MLFRCTPLVPVQFMPQNLSKIARLFVFTATISVFAPCHSAAHTKKRVVSEIGGFDKESPAKAIQADEKPVSAHYQKAEALLDAGQQDIAMMALRHIVLSTGNDELETYFSALLLMTEIYRRKHDFDSAFHLLKITQGELNERVPDTNLIWAKYYHRLGAVLMSRADYEAGITATKQSIELRIRYAGLADTNLVNSYINMGLLNYLTDVSHFI